MFFLRQVGASHRRKDSNGKVYSPAIKEISEVIQTTKAFSFCENPLAFLEKISQTE